MRALAFFVAVLAFESMSAQDYAFKVLISKGQNQIKTGDSWVPVKAGATLKHADVLRISQNGYLGLVHISGKPLELKETGSHKVQDLAARVKQGASVLLKYTDFILSATEVKRNNLTATGAVHRGTDEIHVFLPEAKHAVVFNDEINIIWGKDGSTTSYVVRFNSMFGDELHQVEVNDTTVSLDLKGSRFADEDNILVEVSSRIDPNKKSASLMIKKLSPGDKARIGKLLSELTELNQEKTALNELYLANFYEDHELLIDASTAYHRAIKLAPDVPYFRETYRAFVIRNGLEKEN